MRCALPTYANAALRIAATTLMLTGCAAQVPSAQLSSGQTRSKEAQSSAYLLTQLDYGIDAAYGFCMLPACRRVSAKTPAGVAVVHGTKADAVPRQSNSSGQAPEATPAQPSVGHEHQVIVHFATGSAMLDQQAQRALQQWAAAAPLEGRLRITGRTDSAGPRILNAALARERAASVEAYLRTQFGEKDIQFEVFSGGACCYLADNASLHGRWRNRRVEVAWLSNDPEQVRQ